MVRALPLLRPAHSLRIVRLPAGLDPDDDWVREYAPKGAGAIVAFEIKGGVEALLKREHKGGRTGTLNTEDREALCRITREFRLAGGEIDVDDRQRRILDDDERARRGNIRHHGHGCTGSNRSTLKSYAPTTPTPRSGQTRTTPPPRQAAGRGGP